ncbi:LptA/OstA family protein [Sphingosinicella soli]|uniref:Lipopolysaccharide export system protein LptA n=1 Tax=Sphingosinicella soli TaxID=333708 RepID=A0A7W7B0F4_9SPHN|nr:LptA/OstA family protein [Sphingosinicella soli]MBB4631559.1 lipopolysaccharide export system protein LptA [Sphingosinicella soli]
MIRSALLLAAATALALPLAASAQSGFGNSALKGHDTRAPIDIDAARIEVRDRESQAIFSGDVRVVQGNMTLGAAGMRVFYENAAGGNLAINRLDAEGSVQLVSPSERVSSRLGIYDVQTRRITFVGGVVLNRGDSVLRGERLVIDLESGRSTLDGSASSASGAPRVTGRFVVPPRGGQ